MNITRDTCTMVSLLSLDAMGAMPVVKVDEFGSLCVYNIHILGVTAEGEVDMDTWHRSETSASWRNIE